MRISIGDFLIQRLKEQGIQHIIGVPGDFNLQFLEQVQKASGIEFVGSTNELNGAYAADGYSRSHGLSALCVTDGVGDLGAIAGVAGASAEHIPMIVISGAPPLYAVKEKYQVHHSLGDGNFENIAGTYQEFVDTQVMITPENASFEIDRAIRNAISSRRPVNIQLPSNISYLEIEVSGQPLEALPRISDSERLREALSQSLELFQNAQKPALLIDMDVDRLGLTESMEALVEKAHLPYAQMNTGKAILSETHPLYLGMYKGKDSEPGVQAYIESADFLVTVSPRFIEWNSGGYSQDLPKEHLLVLNRDYISLGEEVYEAVYAQEFLEKFVQGIKERKEKPQVTPTAPKAPTKAKTGPLDHASFWQRMTDFFKPGDLIFGETGTSNTALTGVRLPEKANYVGSQIWGAIGFTLPAYFGSLLANPHRRQILFIGDGSFQITAQEFSNILRHKQKALIFLLNNEGYTIERFIMGMKAPYNDIPQWDYSKLPKVMAKDSQMKTFDVATLEELEEALTQIEIAPEGALIEVHLAKEDAPEAMAKFGEMVAEFNFGDRGPENKGFDRAKEKLEEKSKNRKSNDEK